MTQTAKKYQIFNAFTLKLIMVVLMFGNHITIRIQGLVPDETASFFSLIARPVAPLFAFLAIEGVLHTHSLKKYCQRLFIFAAIMGLGNMIIDSMIRPSLSHLQLTDSFRENHILVHDNIFFTLALGVSAIMCIKTAKEQKQGGYYILAFLCSAIGFLNEWGTVTIPLMLVLYLFREKRIYRYIGYAVIAVIAIVVPWSEPFWFLALPFFALYNGKRGPKNKFTQYFFYVFYAVHIWALTIINFMINYAK